MITKKRFFFLYLVKEASSSLAGSPPLKQLGRPPRSILECALMSCSEQLFHCRVKCDLEMLLLLFLACGALAVPQEPADELRLRLGLPRGGDGRSRFRIPLELRELLPSGLVVDQDLLPVVVVPHRVPEATRLRGGIWLSRALLLGPGLLGEDEGRDLASEGLLRARWGQDAVLKGDRERALLGPGCAGVLRGGLPPLFLRMVCTDEVPVRDLTHLK